MFGCCCQDGGTGGTCDGCTTAVPSSFRIALNGLAFDSQALCPGTRRCAAVNGTYILDFSPADIPPGSPVSCTYRYNYTTPGLDGCNPGYILLFVSDASDVSATAITIQWWSGSFKMLEIRYLDTDWQAAGGVPCSTLNNFTAPFTNTGIGVNKRFVAEGGIPCSFVTLPTAATLRITAIV